MSLVFQVVTFAHQDAEHGTLGSRCAHDLFGRNQAPIQCQDNNAKWWLPQKIIDLTERLVARGATYVSKELIHLYMKVATRLNHESKPNRRFRETV